MTKFKIYFFSNWKYPFQRGDHREAAAFLRRLSVATFRQLVPQVITEYWSLIGQHNKILIYDLSTHSNTDLWSTKSQHWSMTGPHIAILNTDLWLVHKPRYWDVIGWCCSPGPGASPWWPASCSRSPSTSSSTSAWPISASTLASSTSSQARTMVTLNFYIIFCKAITTHLYI